MSERTTFNKTRIAPTPSGYLHVGNVMSFAITAALARRTNAKILLRIDDMDRERTQRQYVQDIFDTLNFLGIPWDEGPRDMREYEQQYAQGHRQELYTKALQQLAEQGNVFACTCTRTQIAHTNPNMAYPGTCVNKGLPLDMPGTSWRMRTNLTEQVTVHTLKEPIITSLPETMQHFMVKKKDGLPAYQLTSVIDDLAFGVDLVVRGEDLWESTVAQHYIARALGQDTFMDTTFHHHRLINDEAGKKLSKSEGATSVHYLRQQHKTAADIFSLIGSIMGIEEPIRSWEELVERTGT